MNYKKNLNISGFFIFIGVISLFITLLSLIINLNNKPNTNSYFTDEIKANENYSQDIASINSIEEFKKIIKKEIESKNYSGLEVPILIDDYVRNKFYHKIANKPWYENWTLKLLDLIFPQYFFSSVMKPNEIIKRDHGICSQQGIIFQEILKDYDLDYATVLLNIPKFQHFATAVKFENHWYFFDTNLEPKHNRYDSKILDDLMNGNLMTLKNLYSGTTHEYLINSLKKNDFEKGMVSITGINTFPAPNGVLVQDICYFLSLFGWLISLLIGYVLIKRSNI